MNFVFNGEIVDYNFWGGKKQTILFLHGWGADKNAFFSTMNLLKSKFNILTLTMPTVKETNLTWKLKTYAEMIINLLKLLNIESVAVVCHSFGFRVACLISKQIKITKIVVSGGAGLKIENPLKLVENNSKKIFLKKWKFLFKSIASKDYIALCQTNKQTFKNIVGLNTKNFVKFNCPMLLFWGKFDKETPPAFAKYVANKNNANLIFSEGGHFAYLTDNANFNWEVNRFLC